MNSLDFMLRWGVITALLLISVVAVDACYEWLHADAGRPALQVAYSDREMMLGAVSESMRALLLCYLFPHLRDGTKSLLDAIRYGLIISALIGTMWLIVGYGSFQLKHPASFIINDTIILFLQGIASGGGLYALSKRPRRM